MIAVQWTTTSGSPKASIDCLKKPLYVCGIGHVCLHGDRLAARGFDLFYDGLRRRRVAGGVHNYSEAVTCQPFCYRTADPSRGACNDGAPRH
jgi:hypothetical protein